MVILAEEENTALVLADDAQLEALARLRFEPAGSDDLVTLLDAAGPEKAWLAASLQPLLAKAKVLKERMVALEGAERGDTDALTAAREALRKAMRGLTPEQKAGLAALSSVDDDGDGLTNTQETWWCTDPEKPDTDNDGINDGQEIQILKDWMANRRSGPPYETPWPDWPPQRPGCEDKDHDSIPNLAERWELGLRMDLESTDHDKFDDGQELFGVTYCPGGDLSCGYGDLPRSSDSGYVGATMPSWVKAPGNHPLVAAFPVPEVDVVESSFHVQTVTTVTTDHTIGKGTEKSYSTAKTEGTSTSVANTVTWDEWQEVSESLQQRLLAEAISAQGASVFMEGQPKWQKWVTGGAKILQGVAAAGAGCAPVFTGVATIPGIFTCIGGVATGVQKIADGVSLLTSPDKTQVAIKANQKSDQPQPISDRNINLVVNQSFDTSNIVQAIEGTRYAYLQTGELLNQRLYEIASILAAPVRTTTTTKGRSWGGARTTTTEEYEEHTVTNGEAFSNSESWGNATAVDSAHAADLWFTYKVRNTGTEYAREIGDLTFNIYIGDDPNPAYTYHVANDIGGDGKFHNFMPDEEHTYTSARIPLTLEQMKAIDLGGPIRIVVEDFTYGIDELFYQDAVNAGVLVAIEDGTDDGDEAIDTYLIPTWGDETVLDVLARYFPHEMDAEGSLIAIWTPEYNRTDTPAWCVEPRRVGTTLWCKHALSTADWWNIYTDGLGDGSQGFQDTPAAPGAVALFRFNKDSDLDGYSDRSERRLGTDPNDPADHPKPELIAGVHSIRSGNQVTATLSLLNTGLYDAYGVEAVMVAPDDSVSITNNTVGGSGRVRAQKQVIVGSRIKVQSPLPAAWTQPGHAVPAVAGYYTGRQDRTYTFTVQCSNPGGCAVGDGTWTLAWDDGAGNSGTLNFGAGYASPTFLDVGTLGVKLALYSGKVYDGESFTVSALTPRDTFQYTINREPYTEPVVIVSYNDPQGNHKFVTPVRLNHPTDDLTAHSGKMIHGGAGVEIVTEAPFTAGQPMTTTLVVQAPARMVDAHLFLEFVDPQGTVVREEATTVTLEPGPNVVAIPWNSNNFNPAYDPNQDYIVMAFFTDWQGNILDTAARPLSSFQADPKPAFALDETATTWDFGNVPQGTILTHTFTLANTGQMDLKATVVGTGARADQEVPGGVVWTDTGLDVAVGDAVGIRAGGQVCYGGNGTTLCHGPDGDGTPAPGDWTAPGVSQFSLVAKIGDGTPFLVGSTYVGTADRAGRLYLGVNDRTGTYGDNGGAYQAHIEVQGLPTTFQNRPGFSVNPTDATGLQVTLDTYYLPPGPFDRTVLVRTGDPAHPTQTFRVTGTVEPYVDPARAMPVAPEWGFRRYRPWDQRVVVAGDHQARDVVTFDDTIAVDAADVHPLRVYDDARQTALGAGREVAGMSGQLTSGLSAQKPMTAPADTGFVRNEQATATSNVNFSGSIFGDGRDGVMPSSGNLDNNHGFGVGSVNGTAGSRTISVIDRHAVWRINPGDIVLIHQTQGTGAGNWELNRAVSDFTGSGTFTLERPLLHTYVSDNGNNHAQIVRVPQYSTCNVTGTVTPLAPWNGIWGGIFAVMCKEYMDISGKVNAKGYGFRGGAGGIGGNNPSSHRHGYQGEGRFGTGRQSQWPNDVGGGGGRADDRANDGGGGGGGGSHATPGQDGTTEPIHPLQDYGRGATAIGGTSDLTLAVFGGGGGGGGTDDDLSTYGGKGGTGGGFIFIATPSLTGSGSIDASGEAGSQGAAVGKDGGGGGGGGAGGSVKLVIGNAGISQVLAAGGRGAPKVQQSGAGGSGGAGRIRIEYCDTFSGSTNPPASVVKVNFCYGTVTGTVFRDDNNNGTQDAGEPGMAGIAVHLRSGSQARKVNTNLPGVLAEQNTTSAQQMGASGSNVFGDGRDGDLVVGPGQTVYIDNARSAIIGMASAGQRVVPIAKQETYEVHWVNGFIQWSDTGLDVVSGRRLRIRATGTLCYAGTGMCYGPDGIDAIAGSGYLGPGLRKYGLIGRIGNGPPFFIGSTLEITASSSGRLYLAPNDDYFSDNTQGYLVDVTMYEPGIPVGFNPGQEVLVIQMAGPGAGQYEFNRIESLGSSSLILRTPLQNTYSSDIHPARAQVIRVPNYRNVRILAGGTLTANRWRNGSPYRYRHGVPTSSGGVVVFRVSDSLVIESGGRLSADGLGFVGGAASPWDWAFTGESYTGWGGFSRQANGGGGGSQSNGTGGGGGYGSPGGNGREGNYGQGGGTYGDALLTKLFLGSGGGGAVDKVNEPWSDGASGGGIILIYAKTIRSNGQLSANGSIPQSARWEGGGGSGGSIKLIGANIVLNTPAQAVGGVPSRNGGIGGVGRIRIEYCDTFSGSTNPPASVAKVNFCYGTVRGTVFRDDNNNGTQDTGEPGMAGIAASLSGVGETVTGSDGSYTFTNVPAPGDYTVSITLPPGALNTTPTSVSCHLEPDGTCTANFGILTYLIEKVAGSDHQNRFYLPESFHGGRRYWVQYGRKMRFDAPSQQQANVQLPMAHYSNVTMDVWLTEPASQNTFVQLDLDVGCDGTSEWSKNANLSIPTVLSTSDLALGVNRFLETATPDANGMVTVPLCLTSNLAATLFLTNLAATPDGLSDVTPTDVSLSPATPVEGDTVTVQATLHNPTVWDSGALTASFFATPPGSSEWYIGSAFVPNVPAGGTAQASIPWHTLGFTGTVPVRVVVDPFNRLAETDETNNETTANLTIRTRPDLRISNLQFSDPEPVVGQPVTVTVTIRNAGQTTAGGQTVALYVGNPDAGGTVVEATGRSPLPGGGTDTVAFTWTPTAPGAYRLFARADRDNAVNEFDEGNNDAWQDVYVGFRGPLLLDSGTDSDPAYTAERGYGVVDEGQPDVVGTCGGGNQPEDSFRRDPDGRVVYRFDHLQPGHFYHLDVTLRECDGASRQERIYVDRYPVSEFIDLGDQKAHQLSIRLDPALYADRAISVTVEAPGIDGAIVNAVNLHDIDYRYADAGGNNDPEYSPQQGYGWLDGVSNTLWGKLPYQSVRVDQNDNELRYRFDGLVRDKRYSVHLTFWQGNGADRSQEVRIDGVNTGTNVTVRSGAPRQDITVDVPPSAYQDDGSIVVSIVRTNASVGAMVNEIALEEETLTRPTEGCNVQTTPFFTYAYGSVHIGDTPAPVGTLVEALNPRGDVVGCFIVRTEGYYGFMPVYGEDSSATPTIPGMREGEVVRFRVGGQDALAVPVLTWHDDKQVHEINLTVGALQEQVINLHVGWNLFSFYMQPPSTAVRDVLAGIEGQYNMVIGEGGSFVPSLPPQFQTLSDLKPGESYWIRITSTQGATLRISGIPVDANTPIPLGRGWHWPGYLPTSPLSVTVALQSIDGKYEMVIGETGTYVVDIPPQFQTLDTMFPGEGYLIRMKEDGVLQYPASVLLRGQGPSPAALPGISCADVANTPYFMDVWGYVRVNGVPADPGTRLEVFTPQGVKAGCFRVQDAGIYGLMRVYGQDDDGVTPGFIPGQRLRWRVDGQNACASIPLMWDKYSVARVDVSVPCQLNRQFVPVVAK